MHRVSAHVSRRPFVSFGGASYVPHRSRSGQGPHSCPFGRLRPRPRPHDALFVYEAASADAPDVGDGSAVVHRHRLRSSADPQRVMGKPRMGLRRYVHPVSASAADLCAAAALQTHSAECAATDSSNSVTSRSSLRGTPAMYIRRRSCSGGASVAPPLSLSLCPSLSLSDGTDGHSGSSCPSSSSSLSHSPV